MAVNPFVTPQVSRWVPALSNSSDVGFFQWKPVSYRQPEPVVEDATPCHHSHPLPQSGEAAAAASGLVRAFYTQPQVFGLNVSFGLAGEPFYNSTRFLSWWVSGSSWAGRLHGWAQSPSASLQDLAGGCGLAPHGLHLPAGCRDDGGGPGGSAAVRAAGHRLRLQPEEGRNHGIRAHQLSLCQDSSTQNSGRPFKPSFDSREENICTHFKF